MVHEIVLLIHDRACAANEQQCIAVVQFPHLVRRQQLFATMSSGEFKKAGTMRIFSHRACLNSVSFFVPCILRADEI